MEIKVELGETKRARRQSIEEEKVERRRLEDVEKNKLLCITKERLSTERTNGNISVKNSRQGQLKWEQK